MESDKELHFTGSVLSADNYFRLQSLCYCELDDEVTLQPLLMQQQTCLAWTDASLSI